HFCWGQAPNLPNHPYGNPYWKSSISPTTQSQPFSSPSRIMRYIWPAYCSNHDYRGSQHATGDFYLLPGGKEQGLQTDRRHGRRFKNRKRGARIHASLVDAHPPCRPPRSREVSRDGAVPLQRNLGCNRRRSLCRKRLQTSACPRLGEGLQDHRQPHPVQPSFLKRRLPLRLFSLLRLLSPVLTGLFFLYACA